MKALLVMAVVLVGMTLPVQAGVNAKLRTYAGDPMLAGLWNFTLGLVLILAIVTVLRVPPPSAGALVKAPWWAWIGGLFGAAVVVTSIIAAPRLGAALLIACLVTGQLTSSVVLDHFGWVGYQVRTITPTRVVGIVLLIAGVVLIERSTALTTPTPVP